MASSSRTFSGRSTVSLRLTVSGGSQSISGNYTNVNWSLDIISSGATFSYDPTGTYSININGTVYTGGVPGFSAYATTRVASGSTRVTHNADGAKTVAASASASGVNLAGSASIPSFNTAMKTIPRASTSTFSGGSSFDAGAAVTINTNRASTSFTHDLTYAVGSASGTAATGVGASYAWTPPLSLLSQVPNGTSIAGVLTTVTKSGSTVIGTKTTAFTLRVPDSVTPNLTAPTFTEMESAVTTAGIGSYVQGVSKLKAVVNASGVYGSTITDRSFKVGNVTVNSASTIDIVDSGTVNVTSIATDSRNREDSRVDTITVQPYGVPNASSVIVRRSTSGGTVSDSGTYLRVDLKATISSLKNGTTEKNKMTIKVYTRARGTTNWGSTPKKLINHTTTSYNSNFVLDGGGVYPVDDSFDVLVMVSDIFDTSDTEVVVPTSSIFMHWSKTGVGIGKYHENGALDLGGDLYMSGMLKAGSVPWTLLTSIPDVAVVTDLGTKDATESPWTYPKGLSIAVAGVGFPTPYGVVETLFLSSERASQRLYEKAAGTRTWHRASSGGAWGEWREIVSRDTVGLPYVMAAGTINTPATGYATVTLPSGRFDKPPIITASGGQQSLVGVPRIVSVTATSFQIAIWTLSGAQISGTNVDWQAIQMTSTSASG